LRHFRNIFFALAAFLWLPASAHCQLESIPGLEIFQCTAESSAAHNSCNDDGCCSVEKSQCHAKPLRITPPTPDSLPAALVPVLTRSHSLPAEVSLGILTAAPPQWVKSRHFISRTALPARAPSLAS